MVPYPPDKVIRPLNKQDQLDMQFRQMGNSCKFLFRGPSIPISSEGAKDERVRMGKLGVPGA